MRRTMHSQVYASSHGRTGMRFKARLDVMRLRSWPDDTETDGFVVLELQFKNGLDNRLTHCKTVLSFPFFDDTETDRSVVVGQKPVESTGHFHGTWHPNDLPHGQTEGASLVG